MHLMYTIDASGKRVYTLKKVVGAEVTKSAHPARFSPDDKYSRHRVTLKKRYGLLLTQQSEFFAPYSVRALGFLFGLRKERERELLFEQESIVRVSFADLFCRGSTCAWSIDGWMVMSGGLDDLGGGIFGLWNT